MQNGATFLSDEDEVENSSEKFSELCYEEALQNIRFYTTDIWNLKDHSKCDGLTSVLCNICLKNELLKERFSTTTAADILADISLDSKPDTTLSTKGVSTNSDVVDFFDCNIFKLKQECQEISCSREKNLNTNQTESCVPGAVRTVGYERNEERQPTIYNHAFDPRQIFAGLQNDVFPNCQFLRKDDKYQDNVCLAVDDVSDIVHEYLNKYHDYLTSLRSPPGNWINQPDAILPAKFASFDLWSADRNEVSVDKESDSECRQLAAKITSNTVKRLWSDGSCYTTSSSEEDVFSHQGSTSEELTSPRAASTTLCPENSDIFPEFPDALSYPFFQTESSKDLDDKPLWSGRDVDSFKDFVPRMSYGFSLPVSDEPEVSGNTDVDISTDRSDEMTSSKFFNIWRVPDSDVGHGDGISSRCSDNSESPTCGITISGKKSPETSWQIPRLVSTKRRERPIRGAKNTRRSIKKDYQVTFVDCAETEENTRYTGQGALSNSRAAISDTTVWSYSDVSEDKRGVSKSETHQEFRGDQTGRRHGQNLEKVELSAKSEPFFPRGSSSRLPGCRSPTGAERLNTIEEERVARDSAKDYIESVEKRTSLSPICEPFVPRSMTRKYLAEEEGESEGEVEEEDVDYLRKTVRADNSQQANFSIADYQTWSPATDGAGKEYKLFGERSYFLDDVFQDSDSAHLEARASLYNEELADLKSPRENEWYKTLEKEKDFKSDSWDTWKSTRETNSLRDVSWPCSDENQTKANTNNVVSGVKTTSVSTHSASTEHLQQHVSQNVWPKPDAPTNQELTKCGSRTSQASSSLSRMSLFPVIEKTECSVPRAHKQASQELLGPVSHSVRLFHNPSVGTVWPGTDRPTISTSYQDGTRFLQPQSINPVRSSASVTFMHNQMTCLPTQQHYDNSCRKMVVLRPHPKQPEPRPAMHGQVFAQPFAPQHATLKPAYPPLQQPLSQAVHRVSLEQRLQPQVLSRPSPPFAHPPAGFAPSLPAQTYRHVTVATNYNPPKLVAVPAFDARAQPRFFAPFLNFNNHNEAYSSDSEMCDSSFDLIGCRDDEHDRCEKRVRARPIKANPANLIHIT